MTPERLRNVVDACTSTLAMCVFIGMAIGGLGMVAASIWCALVMAGEP